jgi:hypothetical protein
MMTRADKAAAETSHGRQAVRLAGKNDGFLIERCAMTSLGPEESRRMSGREKARYLYMYRKMARVYFVKLDDEIVGYFECSDDPVFFLEGEAYGKRYSTICLRFFDPRPSGDIEDFVSLFLELTKGTRKDGQNLLYAASGGTGFEGDFLGQLSARGFRPVAQEEIPRKVIEKAERMAARFGIPNPYGQGNIHVLARMGGR